MTFDNAIKLDKKLVALLKVYTDNLKGYIAKTAKDIGILFHIYSGRLLQNFQNGLGVFIESDGKSIAFKENPNKEHDVIFSMS